ncbi:MAG: hypothetical protein WCC60_00895 [Ilumatobacteraceae bacterium]
MIAERSQFQPVNAAATSTAGSVDSGARVVGATTGTVELVVDATRVVPGADVVGSSLVVASNVVADSFPRAQAPRTSATTTLAERHIGFTAFTIPLTSCPVKGTNGLPASTTTRSARATSS